MRCFRSKFNHISCHIICMHALLYFCSVFAVQIIQNHTCIKSPTSSTHAGSHVNTRDHNMCACCVRTLATLSPPCPDIRCVCGVVALRGRILSAVLLKFPLVLFMVREFYQPTQRLPRYFLPNRTLSPCVCVCVGDARVWPCGRCDD